jgi:hypothetical protein
LTYLGRRFGLSDVHGVGISCSEDGAFIGAIPLLQRVAEQGPGGQSQWRPRPVSALNHDLGICYGLPVDLARAMDGVRAVAAALSRGDVLHARIAMLHLQIPNPAAPAKSAQTRDEAVDLLRQLQASGLLKAEWDPAKHPRWPAGSTGGIGGEFAPAGVTTDGSAAGEAVTEPSAPIIPAQITIPAPFDLPSEILPPPAIPDIYPRELRNPYPDRAGCDEEWADAIAYCKGLLERNQLGRGDYRGSGKSLYQCIMGQVSERCGGSSTGA